MPSEKIQDYFNGIKEFAEEIGKRDLPLKYIETARKNDKQKLEELTDQFTSENPELWRKMCKLFDRYEEDKKPIIFGDGTECDGEDVCEYDPEEIEPNNLWLIFIFSGGCMDDYELFSDCELFRVMLEEVQPEIARYLEEDSLHSFDNLIEAVN